MMILIKFLPAFEGNLPDYSVNFRELTDAVMINIEPAVNYYSAERLSLYCSYLKKLKCSDSWVILNPPTTYEATTDH